MKVYLDDERQTPDGWHRVYWPEDAITLLKQGIVTEISLDHDLGDDEHGTGYDVILWIEEAVATQGFQPTLIRVHSANSSTSQKMEFGITNIKRLSMLIELGHALLLRKLSYIYNNVYSKNCCYSYRKRYQLSFV
ncbi:cyclic-phosphate processing receiver domain-containing protein [Vibrio diazotrophicus]|uniref:cyclic-phosphate processing receiver domain-containing protein n=1 Tax=Vibrio diazotrophicus TaxID=685 RepID=UPI001CA53D6A|nr:cyclic-phosphate processing receiver domain-containing protein [Vibrio diazotrophicus]